VEKLNARQPSSSEPRPQQAVLAAFRDTSIVTHVRFCGAVRRRIELTLCRGGFASMSVGFCDQVFAVAGADGMVDLGL
jgi:hypothetical protein